MCDDGKVKNMVPVRNLVVVIPAFNESKNIGGVIRGIPRRISRAKKVSVLVVDDGSTDDTAKVARSAGADLVVSHGTNRGLGVAFRTGIENALKMGAEIVVNIDADGQFNAKDIAKLIEPVLSGRADMATCTRFSERMPAQMPFMKRIGNRFFTWLTSLLTGQRFTDTQCGFRAYSREACLRMNLFGRFTYTQEVLLDLKYNGLRIVEVPLEVKPQRAGKSRVVRHWWEYGLRAIIIIIRAIRDHFPLQFFGTLGTVFMVSAVIRAMLLPSGILTEGLMIAGLLLIILALLADMQYRTRRLVEEHLYIEKKRLFEKCG